MAAFKLNASIRAVSWRVRVFPTLRTSIPSVVIPTLNSAIENNWLLQRIFQTSLLLTYYEAQVPLVSVLFQDPNSLCQFQGTYLFQDQCAPCQTCEHTWMLPDPSLYDVSNVFKSWSILLQHVVAEGDVVGEVWFVANNLHCLSELRAGIIKVSFLKHKDIHVHVCAFSYHFKQNHNCSSVWLF